MRRRLARGGDVVDVHVVAHPPEVRLPEQHQRDLPLPGGQLVLVQAQRAQDHPVDHRIPQPAGDAQLGARIPGGVVHQHRAPVPPGRRDHLDRELREVGRGQFGEGQRDHPAAARAQPARRDIGLISERVDGRLHPDPGPLRHMLRAVDHVRDRLDRHPRGLGHVLEARRGARRRESHPSWSQRSIRSSAECAPRAGVQHHNSAFANNIHNSLIPSATRRGAGPAPASAVPVRPLQRVAATRQYPAFPAPSPHLNQASYTHPQKASPCVHVVMPCAPPSPGSASRSPRRRAAAAPHRPALRRRGGAGVRRAARRPRCRLGRDHVPALRHLRRGRHPVRRRAQHRPRALRELQRCALPGQARLGRRHDEHRRALRRRLCEC